MTQVVGFIVIIDLSLCPDVELSHLPRLLQDPALFQVRSNPADRAPAGRANTSFTVPLLDWGYSCHDALGLNLVGGDSRLLF